MTTTAKREKRTGAKGLTSPDQDRSIHTEDRMTEPKKSEGMSAGKAPDLTLLDRLPAAAKKFLLATPENDWPKLRLVICGCEPAGDLMELVSEMNRVMQICPGIISAREWKGQLARSTGDKAYCRLHDAVHGVRQALHEILHRAGLLEAVQPRPARPEGNATAEDLIEVESAAPARGFQGPAAPSPTLAPATVSRKV
jgi:hypothetical protein